MAEKYFAAVPSAYACSSCEDVPIAYRDDRSFRQKLTRQRIDRVLRSYTLKTFRWHGAMSPGFPG
jgi:hypothetical protein